MWDFRWWLADWIEDAASWLCLRLRFSKETRETFGIDE